MSRPQKVMLDPGHGGLEPGAIAAFPNVVEKDINLNIAKLCRRYVKRGDFLYRPYMTRSRDRTLSLVDRVKKSIKKDVDAFVSFHCNSWSDPEVEGVEVYFKPGSVLSRHLAQNVHDELLANMPGHKDRGVKPGNYYVIRENEEPAILIEFEFLSNPMTAAYLFDADNQRMLAKCVGDAIEYFLESAWI